MNMQCADVRKTLASVHRVNQGGNAVVLDGNKSYILHKSTGNATPIKYEDGQYVFHARVKQGEKAASKDAQGTLAGDRFATLAVEGEETNSGKAGFRRRGQVL